MVISLKLSGNYWKDQIKQALHVPSNISDAEFDITSQPIISKIIYICTLMGGIKTTSVLPNGNYVTVLFLIDA